MKTNETIKNLQNGSSKRSQRRTEKEINESSPLTSVVRNSRKLNGLTQEQAAARIGVSLNFYRKLESGDSHVQLSKVMQVLEFFGIQIEFKRGR